MNKKLIDWWTGGASLNAYVVAWSAQVVADGGTEPSATVKTALSTALNSLDSAGYISRMKAMWILHSGDVTTARRNVLNPSAYRMAVVGTTPTFLEGTGTKSADATSCFNTTYPGNAYAGIQTDLTAFAYVPDSSSTSASGDLYGARINTDFSLYRMTPKSGAAAATHTRFEGSGVAPTNAALKGFYCDTYDGTNRVFYKSGVKTSASMTPTAPNIAAPLGLLARNANGGSGFTISSPFPYYCAYFILWDRFADADESAVRAIFTTYNTAVGIP